MQSIDKLTPYEAGSDKFAQTPPHEALNSTTPTPEEWNCLSKRLPIVQWGDFNSTARRIRKATADKPLDPQEYDYTKESIDFPPQEHSSEMAPQALTAELLETMALYELDMHLEQSFKLLPKNSRTYRGNIYTWDDVVASLPDHEDFLTSVLALKNPRVAKIERNGELLIVEDHPESMPERKGVYYSVAKRQTSRFSWIDENGSHIVSSDAPKDDGVRILSTRRFPDADEYYEMSEHGDQQTSANIYMRPPAGYNDSNFAEYFDKHNGRKRVSKQDLPKVFQGIEYRLIVRANLELKYDPESPLFQKHLEIALEGLLSRQDKAVNDYKPGRLTRPTKLTPSQASRVVTSIRNNPEAAIALVKMDLAGHCPIILDLDNRGCYLVSGEAKGLPYEKDKISYAAAMQEAEDLGIDLISYKRSEKLSELIHLSTAESIWIKNPNDKSQDILRSEGKDIYSSSPREFQNDMSWRGEKFIPWS
jgi:hypothetical protein